MATNPDAPKLVFSKGLVLPDGRKVRVLGYKNGEVRFRLEGAPYVLSECFIGAGQNGHAIVKLSPGKQGSATYGTRLTVPEIPEVPDDES